MSDIKRAADKVDGGKKTPSHDELRDLKQREVRKKEVPEKKK